MVDGFNRRRGSGSRLGTWLLERAFTPCHGYPGTWLEGCRALLKPKPHQGLDPAGIISHVPEPRG